MPVLEVCGPREVPTGMVSPRASRRRRSGRGCAVRTGRPVGFGRVDGRRVRVRVSPRARARAVDRAASVGTQAAPMVAGPGSSLPGDAVREVRRSEPEATARRRGRCAGRGRARAVVAATGVGPRSDPGRSVGPGRAGGHRGRLFHTRWCGGRTGVGTPAARWTRAGAAEVGPGFGVFGGALRGAPDAKVR